MIHGKSCAATARPARHASARDENRRLVRAPAQIGSDSRAAVGHLARHPRKGEERMTRSVTRAALWAVVVVGACSPAPAVNGGNQSVTFKPAPPPQAVPLPPLPATSKAAMADPACTSASLRLYSQDHFMGDEICFYGDGTVQLADYRLASNPVQNWLGHVQGMEVGVQPIFLNGVFKAGESFSWFYPGGLTDDIGSDLPFGLTSITMAAGYDVGGATCGGGTCGYATSAGGHVVVCGQGACPNTQACVNNVCCVPDNAAACANRECGTAVDNCGQTIDCGLLAGACADPQRICTGAGRCCYPPAVACANQQCGTASDGCGNQVACGSCYTGYTCQNNQCVSTCRPRHCPVGSYWNPDDCACERACRGITCQ
jgi:hypothetical protein